MKMWKIQLKSPRFFSNFIHIFLFPEITVSLNLEFIIPMHINYYYYINKYQVACYWLHIIIELYIVVIQSLSPVQFLVTPWTAAHQASLSFTISLSFLKLMSIESVMPSNHLIFCHPLLLPPSVFPSIRVFSNEPALHIWWPNYWSFSFSISPSNGYSGLISFRMDWFYLLAVQGTLKSLL